MCHVLINEDEPLIALTIQDLFEDEGAASSEVAATEAQAVAAARDHRPNLITSDVELIEGAGPAAVAAIHKRLGTCR